MKIYGTVRDPDWSVETVEIDRDVYDDGAYRELRALTPEGWALLHGRVEPDRT